MKWARAPPGLFTAYEHSVSTVCSEQQTTYFIELKNSGIRQGERAACNKDPERKVRLLCNCLHFIASTVISSIT